MLTISRLGISRAGGAASRWAAVTRPSSCAAVASAAPQRFAALSVSRRYTASMAQASPEEVWGWIVEMFAVNGDTNYGRCFCTIAFAATRRIKLTCAC
jgi:hypothetical protein